VTANKAITVFGGFNATAGLFEVGGDINAYFADISSVQAIQDNKTVTLDIWIQRGTETVMFDIPTLTLNDGQLKVEIDAPVMLPMTNEAAESAFNSTLLFNWFHALPAVAHP
jgi:hypothetical protein